jgi:RNA recognition motif-containing protein
MHRAGLIRVDGNLRPEQRKESEMAEKLFVGGLSFNTTDEGLRDAFARYGKVDSAQVVRGPDGRSRGFGFVEMASPEDAERAIGGLNGSSLDGRTIRVEKAGAPPRPGRRVGAPTRW